jgi:hypothetical protein
MHAMKKIKLQIQKAIINQNLIEFEYRDKTKNKEGVRTIEPYLFGVDKNGSYFVSGYDTDSSVPEELKHKNYLISQIDRKNFKILKEQFTDLKIDSEKIYETKETIIICVVDFQELIEKIIERRKRAE